MGIFIQQLIIKTGSFNKEKHKIKNYHKEYAHLIINAIFSPRGLSDHIYVELLLKFAVI